MPNKEIFDIFERIRSEINEEKLAFEERQSLQLINQEKLRKKEERKSRINPERLKKFKEYQPQIYSFLDIVNQEIFNNKAKVKGWKQTMSRYDSPGGGRGWGEYRGFSKGSEQIETVLSYQDYGSVRVALLLRSWESGTAGFVTYEPNSIIVEREFGLINERPLSKTTNSTNEISLDLNKDEFFKLLEDKVIKESVEVAKAPYRK
jgi:hypothetical protein